jgi:glycosyltransferase involved in cell wall biosynthesis
LRFTIIIPCLDRPDDLRVAIKSCVTQTFTDFELLVVDDCSTQPLEEICNEFGDVRIKCYRNAVNRGVSHCRNIGLDAAVGEYVSFLDSDDIYLPNRLEVLDRYIRVAETPPSILFHRQNRRLAPNDAGIVAPARLPATRERLDDYVLIWGNFIQTNSFIIETQLAKKVKFDLNCRIHEDTKFLIECWLTSPNYVACQEILSDYHDFRVASRLSKQRGGERLQPMLLFTQHKCSRAAHVGFAAYASAELPFFRGPLRVLINIWRAYRAGVPKLRCAVYLGRSIFGVTAVDDTIYNIRLFLFRLGRSVRRQRFQPN